MADWVSRHPTPIGGAEWRDGRHGCHCLLLAEIVPNAGRVGRNDARYEQAHG
jgi:hypothetical protein